MEANNDRFMVSTVVFLFSWIVLCLCRRSFDTIIAFGLLNIHILAWVYLNGQVGEFSDPDRAHTFILQLFLLGDSISTWLQAIASSELKITSHLIWCFFGKICLLISLLILFDDRWPLIFQYLGVSVISLVVQSICQRELVQSQLIDPASGVKTWVQAYVYMFLDISFQIRSICSQLFTKKKSLKTE